MAKGDFKIQASPRFFNPSIPSLTSSEHKEISPYFELQHTAVEAEKPETCTLYLPLDGAEETKLILGR